MAVSIYSNAKLSALQETEFQLSNLLLNWREAETVSQELLTTYNLIETQNKWLSLNNQFNKEFHKFLKNPFTKKQINNNYYIQSKIAIAKLRWEIIQSRLITAVKLFEDYNKFSNSKSNSGNLLIDFGENMAQNSLSKELMELLKILRRNTTVTNFAFTEGLEDISKFLKNKIKIQNKQIRINSFFLSFLIILISGFYIMSRFLELNRLRLFNTRHANELSAEIRERNAVEKILINERDKLRTVLNAMGDFMYIINDNYNIEFQNDILASIYKDNEEYKCYKKYHGLEAPCSFCSAIDVLKNNSIKQVEAIFGNNEAFEVVFSPFKDIDGKDKILVLNRNITKRKKYEAEVVRASHLASIGELAAGVAHEINNPISGVINYVESLEDILQEHSIDAFDIPNKIIDESERIAKIVRNLLSFAREDKGEHTQIKVESVLNNSLDLYGKQLLNSGIKLLVDIQPDLPDIMARSDEIQQVFLNILLNAKYALNEKYPEPCNSKKLSIRAMVVEIDKIKYVRIIFADSGTGIPEDVKDKIINPFFSTKPKNRGTGLGLSISHGIIKSFNGRLNFQSEAGEYTEVLIDFPAIEK
ncbi:MAG: hypothetical protein K9L30_16655 [Desulfobacterales bacterium]|nr:hypothetical protein [Desulfobacterales bacterium]